MAALIKLFKPLTSELIITFDAPKDFSQMYETTLQGAAFVLKQIRVRNDVTLPYSASGTFQAGEYDVIGDYIKVKPTTNNINTNNKHDSSSEVSTKYKKKKPFEDDVATIFDAYLKPEISISLSRRNNRFHLNETAARQHERQYFDLEKTPGQNCK